MNLTTQVRTAFKIASVYFLKKRIPISAYWISTNRCINNCAYCNYRAFNASGELDTETSLLMIESLARAGNSKLHISGGEPLLREDVEKVVHSAHEKRIMTGISTSGYSVPDRIKNLLETDLFFISLDGPEKIHDMQRGKGTFKMATGAIESIKRHGKKVWTTTVLTKNNISHIDEVISYAKSNGLICNFTFLNYHQPTDENAAATKHIPSENRVKSLVLSDEEMRETIRLLISRKQEGAPIGSSESFFNYLLSWKNFKVPYLKEPHGGVNCLAGRAFLYINPDGTVFPCGDLYWRADGVRFSRDNSNFKDIMRALPEIPCYSCRTACYIEQNLFFSFRPGTIFNWLKLKIKNKW